MEVSVEIPNTAETMENITANIDSNGNDKQEEDHDTIEDNINEAASEDSGMSSVDNHNLSGKNNYSLTGPDDNDAGRMSEMQQLAVILKNQYLTQMHTTQSNIFNIFCFVIVVLNTLSFISNSFSFEEIKHVLNNASKR